MKQTEKQKEEILKNQTQVNGHTNFKNGKLQTPKTTKKTEDKKPTTKKTEPKKVDTKVKPQVTVVSFLTFLKKNLDNIESSTTRDNYTKIKIDGKVHYYLKQGVRKPQVLGWNQIQKKQMHIVTTKDMDKLLVEVQQYKK